MQNPFENKKFIDDLEKLLVKYDVNDWVCLPVRVLVEYLYASLRVLICVTVEDEWKEQREKEFAKCQK